MLRLTDKAGDCIAQMLEEGRVPANQAIRLILDPSGTLEPTIDRARPGDVTYEHQGRLVLLLDDAALSILADRQLEVRQTADGPQLDAIDLSAAEA